MVNPNYKWEIIILKTFHDLVRVKQAIFLLPIPEEFDMRLRIPVQ
jgi:hypothetical protein